MKAIPAMIINIIKVLKNFFILYYNNTYIDFFATYKEGKKIIGKSCKQAG